MAVTETKIWCGCNDSNIYVWERETINQDVLPIKCLSTHSAGVTSLLSLGSEIWSTSTDKTICVWNNITCTLIHQQPSSHASSITFMKQITSAQLHRVWTVDDKSVRMWEERAAFDFGDGYFLHDIPSSNSNYTSFLSYRYVSPRSPMKDSRALYAHSALPKEDDLQLDRVKKQLSVYKKKLEAHEVPNDNQYDLQDQLEAKQVVIGGLQHENDQLARFIVDLVSNLNPNEGTHIHNLKDKAFISYITNNHERLLGDLTEVKQIDSTQLNKVQATNTSLLTRLEHANSDINSLHETVAELERELQVYILRDEDSRKNEQLSRESDSRSIELEKQCAQKNRLIHSQLEQIRVFETLNRELTEKLTLMETEMATSKLNTSKSNEEGIQRLEQLLNSARKDKLEIEKQFVLVKEENSRLSRNAERLESENEIIAAKLQACVDDAEREISQSHIQLSKMKEQAQQFEQKAAELEKQVQAYLQRHNTLYRQQEDTKALLEKSENLVLLQEQLRESNRERTKLQNENDKCMEKLVRFEQRSEEFDRMVVELEQYSEWERVATELKMLLDSQESTIENEVNKLKQENSQLRDNIAVMERQLAQERQKSEKLTSELDTKNDDDRSDLEKRVSQQNKLVSAQSSVIMAKEKTIEDLRSKLEASRNDYEQALQKCEDLAKNTESAVHDYKAQIRQLTTELVESKSTIHQVHLEQKLIEQKTITSSLMAEISERDTLIVDLRAEVDRLTTERDSILDRLRDSEPKRLLGEKDKATMIRSQQELISEYAKQNDELQAEVDRLKAADRDVDEVKRQYQQLLQIKSNQKREIEELVQERDALIVELKNYENMVIDEQQLVDRVQIDLQTAEGLKDTHKQGVIELTEKNLILEATVTELKSRILDYELEIKNLRTHLEIKSRAAERQSSQQDLRRENQHTVDQLQHLLKKEQETNSALQQDLDRQLLLIETQGHTIAAKDQRISMLQERLNEAESDGDKESAVKAQLDSLSTREELHDAHTIIETLQKRIIQLEEHVANASSVMDQYDATLSKETQREMDAISALPDKELDIAHQLQEELERCEQEAMETRLQLVKIINKFATAQHVDSNEVNTLLKEVDRNVTLITQQVKTDEEKLLQLEHDNNQAEQRHHRMQDQIDLLAISNEKLSEQIIDVSPDQQVREELIVLYKLLSDEDDEDDVIPNNQHDLIKLVGEKVVKVKRNELPNDMLDVIISEHADVPVTFVDMSKGGAQPLSLDQKIATLGELLGDKEQNIQELKHEIVQLQQCMDGVSRILKQQCDKCNQDLGDLQVKTKEMYTDEEWTLVSEILQDMEQNKSILEEEEDDGHAGLDEKSKTKYYVLKQRVSETCLILINLKKANDLIMSQLEEISVGKIEFKHHPMELQQLLVKAHNLVHDGSNRPASPITPKRYAKKGILKSPSSSSTPTKSVDFNLQSEIDVVDVVEKLIAMVEHKGVKPQQVFTSTERELANKNKQIQTLTKTKAELEANIKQLKSRISQLEKAKPEKSPSTPQQYRAIDITFTPQNEKPTTQNSSLLKQYVQELTVKVQEKEQELAARLQDNKELKEIIHEMVKVRREIETELRTTAQLIEDDLNKAIIELQLSNTEENRNLVLVLTNEIASELQAMVTVLSSQMD